MEIKLVKGKRGDLKAAAPLHSIDPATGQSRTVHLSASDVAATQLQDNQDNTYSVSGMDDHVPPNVIDLTPLATLAALSSDDTIFTAPAPVGMDGVIDAVKAGAASLGLDATFNDGVTPGLHIDVPVTVVKAPPGAPTSLVVTFGTPTIQTVPVPPAPAPVPTPGQ